VSISKVSRVDLASSSAAHEELGSAAHARDPHSVDEAIAKWRIVWRDDEHHHVDVCDDDALQTRVDRVRAREGASSRENVRDDTLTIIILCEPNPVTDREGRLLHLENAPRERGERLFTVHVDDALSGVHADDETLRVLAFIGQSCPLLKESYLILKEGIWPVVASLPSAASTRPLKVAQRQGVTPQSIPPFARKTLENPEPMASLVSHEAAVWS
jgi:hypothetical protein